MKRSFFYSSEIKSPDEAKKPFEADSYVSSKVPNKEYL